MTAAADAETYPDAGAVGGDMPAGDAGAGAPGAAAPRAVAIGNPAPGPERVPASAKPNNPATPAAQPRRITMPSGLVLSPTSGSPTHWSLIDAVAVLAIALIALLAKNAVLAMPQVALMPVLGKTAVRVAVLVAFYVGQFAAFGWLAARHGAPALEALGLRRPSAQGAADVPAAQRPSALASAGLVVALAFGYEVVTITYGLTMRALGSAPPSMLSSDLSHIFGAGPVGLAFAALLVAIAAPFAEEIAFRGVVLPALGDRWGGWVGIGGSAVLFAAYHMQPWLAFPMLVFGAVLGWLTWTRRSLWPAIALHVLCNAISVLAAFAPTR